MRILLLLLLLNKGRTIQRSFAEKIRFFRVMSTEYDLPGADRRVDVFFIGIPLPRIKCRCNSTGRCGSFI